MSAPEEFSNVRVVTDGTAFGTDVLFDGKPMLGVRKVELTIDAARGQELATAVIVLEGVRADVRLPRKQVATVLNFIEEPGPDLPRDTHICPECRNGKHMNCGPALNEQTDEVVPCECEYGA